MLTNAKYIDNLLYFVFYKKRPFDLLLIMSYKTQPRLSSCFLYPSIFSILYRLGPFALAFIFIFSGDLFARTQINSLLRAKRWGKIKEHFQRKSPRHDQESYAIALALLENKRAGKLSSANTVRAFLHFFSILDIACPQAKKSKNKKDLLACIKSVPRESRGGSRAKNIQRLSAWQASKQAERYKMPWLSLYLISVASLRAKDPFTEKIFQQRMQQLIRNKIYASAIVLAKRRGLKHCDSPFSNFLRARAYAYRKQKTQALSFYFQAAWTANVSWLRKSILNDIKKFYPQLLSSASKGNKIGPQKAHTRQILSLSDLLSRKQIKGLKKQYSFYTIKKSTSEKRLRMDGIFLIKSGQEARLSSLADGFDKHIEKNPEILKDWGSRLQSSGKRKASLKLLQKFRRVMPRSAALWQVYLDLLVKRGKGKRSMKYFRELLAYLKQYPYHRNAQDALMESLIGSEQAHIDWAPFVYWQRAKKELPHRAASGRFFYWLKRYYEKHARTKDSKSIKKDFYIYAPGSFYAAENWAKNKPGRYIKAWHSISNRQAYLRWLSEYGGQKRARDFLRRKNIRKYQDPKAQEIERALRNTAKPSNNILSLLFSLGEWVTGVHIFRELYAEKLPRREYLLRLIRMGSSSGNLNVQVYYLRKLLWEEGVPLDPFSLPPSLSKLLHPRPYFSLVRRYSQRYGMEVSTSYALIHQESLFRESAVSRSGARGLMQVMPRTGKWLAPRVLKTKRIDLKDPATNIHLGVYYFSQLMKQNQNNFRWAAIAYNGGPGNLRKWKRKYYKGDFYHFLERLPVNEARNYCRITYENYLRYKITYYLYP